MKHHSLTEVRRKGKGRAHRRSRIPRRSRMSNARAGPVSAWTYGATIPRLPPHILAETLLREGKIALRRGLPGRWD
jgi:hypothetical protein